ncbi:MAG: NAD-dependent protein deacylase [Clostridia bacterium]|nr:NAD-dependent protein deacylase [Clostridia bacterium]
MDRQGMIEAIKAARRIVFFGGAGVSTESGIPDFRSKDGLYNQHYRYPPEEILSHDFLLNNPTEFWRFYRDKILVEGIEPNITHRVLARWEQEGKLLAVITQNIDDLHEKAGSTKLFKLHGSVTRNYCLKCGRQYGIKDLGKEGVPHCTCGGVIRPDVVMYGENLDFDVVEGAIDALSRADLLIVAGTSLAVYPAAGLIDYYQGNKMVLINRDPTPYDRYATWVCHESLGKVFSEL